MRHSKCLVIAHATYGLALKNLQELSQRWKLLNHQTIQLSEGAYLVAFFDDQGPSQADLKSISIGTESTRLIENLDPKVWECHLGLSPGPGEIQNLVIMEFEFLGDQFLAATKTLDLGGRLIEMRSGRGSQGLCRLIVCFDQASAVPSLQSVLKSEIKNFQWTEILSPTDVVKSYFQFFEHQ